MVASFASACWCLFVVVVLFCFSGSAGILWLVVLQLCLLVAAVSLCASGSGSAGAAC